MANFSKAGSHAGSNTGSHALANHGGNLAAPGCLVPLSDQEASVDGLHRVKIMAQSNPVFARALRSTGTTEAAARLARIHGIVVSPEALWRHRGTLTEAGLPTWRG
jgi:hypothetical protein